MRIALVLFVLLFGAGAVGIWVYMFVRTGREFIESLGALDELYQKEGEALRKSSVPRSGDVPIPKAFLDAFPDEQPKR